MPETQPGRRQSVLTYTEGKAAGSKIEYTGGQKRTWVAGRRGKYETGDADGHGAIEEGSRWGRSTFIEGSARSAPTTRAAVRSTRSGGVPGFHTIQQRGRGKKGRLTQKWEGHKTEIQTHRHKSAVSEATQPAEEKRFRGTQKRFSIHISAPPSFRSDSRFGCGTR